MSGTATIAGSTTSIATQNGRIPAKIRCIGISCTTPLTTKTLFPTGGVIKLISTTITTTTPSQIKTKSGDDGNEDRQRDDKHCEATQKLAEKYINGQDQEARSIGTNVERREEIETTSGICVRARNASKMLGVNNLR